MSCPEIPSHPDNSLGPLDCVHLTGKIVRHQTDMILGVAIRLREVKNVETLYLHNLICTTSAVPCSSQLVAHIISLCQTRCLPLEYHHTLISSDHNSLI
jgi:hypothetical protein